MSRVSQPFEARIPLSDSTNSSRIYRNSSESGMSSPGSIFNALPGSENEIVPTSETGGHQSSNWAEQLPPVQTIHYPTALDTITEKTSRSTIRLAAAARTKKSFSHDDICWITRKAKFWKSSDSSLGDSLRHHTIDYPKRPPRRPPARQPTPPRLPSFNTIAASEYRLPPPELRFRDIFRVSPSPAEMEYIRQTTGLPRGALMRSDDGTLVKGRWRPDQSGHTGHPYRPTPRPGPQGSQIALQAAPNTTTTTIRHGPPIHGTCHHRNRWIRLAEKICCYRDKEDGEQMLAPRVLSSVPSSARIAV